MGRSSNFGPKTQIMHFWSAHITSSTSVETGYNTYHTSFLRIFRQDVGAHHIHSCTYWKAIIAFLGDIWPQTPVEGPIVEIVADASRAIVIHRLTGTICLCVATCHKLLKWSGL